MQLCPYLVLFVFDSSFHGIFTVKQERSGILLYTINRRRTNIYIYILRENKSPPNKSHNYLLSEEFGMFAGAVAPNVMQQNQEQTAKIERTKATTHLQVITTTTNMTKNCGGACVDVDCDAVTYTWIVLVQNCMFTWRSKWICIWIRKEYKKNTRNRFFLWMGKFPIRENNLIIPWLNVMYVTNSTACHMFSALYCSLCALHTSIRYYRLFFAQLFYILWMWIGFQ